MSSPVVEDEWQAALAARDLRAFRLQDFSRALVVAAHPDDETLGVGGLLHRLHDDGIEVTLVLATDGEGAFPDSTPAEKSQLAETRRRELNESLDAQGLDAVRPVWLGLPDSGLSRHRRELTERLAELAKGRDLCLAPWPDDPHPDHQAAGLAMLAAAPVGAHCWSYPIWLWHRLHPDDASIPWDRACRLRLSETDRQRKSAGIAAFASQLTPGPRGEEPILPPAVLAHFERDTEIVFREPPRTSAPEHRFAELYARDADPWRVSTDWYEIRRRAIVSAALPARRYGCAVEPACGIGALTLVLAQRCDRLLAFDPIASAVERTRFACSGRSSVDVRVGSLPADLPPGPQDLLVYSEILYYLDDRDLTATIEASVACLRPGGHLLAVHWRSWPPEAPRDGEDVHRRLLAHPALTPLIEHVEDEFLLHVLERR
ncbi:bifunctional PIG-L family deacetylase/class I SAM-dependent methyltransferase [Actinoalloteichus fjordicus]|uniref:Uncharacterized protein n=1 Tax=Actinoalloteichus fjordicus TaxID=1612552 RepID=A0AAC9L9D9_9PSEU|nr:bifunctional PIG-L family deacetylase/class I SAM-dependent methyltransferase [Actinoalloteichus fjordicus]APU13618.1 hypothetical protein UA74_07745 [Actinoalloteichus fjordicus]